MDQDNNSISDTVVSRSIPPTDSIFTRLATRSTAESPSWVIGPFAASIKALFCAPACTCRTSIPPPRLFKVMSLLPSSTVSAVTETATSCPPANSRIIPSFADTCSAITKSVSSISMAPSLEDVRFNVVTAVSRSIPPVAVAVSLAATTSTDEKPSFVMEPASAVSRTSWYTGSTPPLIVAACPTKIDCDTANDPTSTFSAPAGTTNEASQP